MWFQSFPEAVILILAAIGVITILRLAAGFLDRKNPSGQTLEQIRDAIFLIKAGVDAQVRIMEDGSEYVEDPLLRQVFGAMDDARVEASKRHDRQLAALDSLCGTMEKFATSQDRFLSSMFGEPVPAPDGEDPEIQKAVERLLRRYPDLSPGEARKRAKGLLVYDVNGGGMGARE